MTYGSEQRVWQKVNKNVKMPPNEIRNPQGGMIVLCKPKSDQISAGKWELGPKTPPLAGLVLPCISYLERGRDLSECIPW